MALAETWLTDDVSSGEIAIPHFLLHRKDRTGEKKGGGVAVYSHESVGASRRHDLEDDALEIMWMEVQCKKQQKMMIGCFYRPPSLSVEHWHILEQNLRKVQSVSDNIVIMGDFNVNYLDPTDRNRPHLSSLMSQFCLINHVTASTRVSGTSASTIDLIMTTRPIEGNCEILRNDISDHYTVLAHLPGKAVQSKQHGTYKSRNLWKVNWDMMRMDLKEALSTFDSSSDLNETATLWSDTVMDVFDQHAPLKVQHKSASRPCPWLTKELQSAVRERNSLHKKLCQDPDNDQLRLSHKAARRKARQLDRRLSNKYFKEMCSQNSSRMMWKAINTVTGRSKVRQTPNTSLDSLSTAFGEIVTDPNRPEKLPVPFGPSKCKHLSALASVDVTDTLELLLSVDPSKAMGSDQLPGIVLRQCAAELAPSLTIIFNMSLRSGKVPHIWKVSYVSPLFKSGDSSEPRNYRPISLLPIVSRLLEKIVQRQLVSFLEDQDLLPTSQFAYRSAHSTEDALVLAVNRWQLAKHNRMTTGVAMIDMSKAFDRVLHAKLISSLFSLGIDGLALHWLVDYLSDRTQQVKHGDELSLPHVCTRGVPQGSVLGPLLFALYIRGLRDILPAAITNQEFADDIILDCSNSDQGIVVNSLSKAVTLVENWLGDLGLTINKQKTQVIFIPPRGVAPPAFKVKCGTTEISTVESAKYLGLHITSELSWSLHLQHLTKKVNQLAGAIWRHGKALTYHARRTWLTALVRSHLTYASNAFFPSLMKSEQEKITKLFKYSVRSVFRVHPPTSTQPLLDILCIPDIISTYQKKLAIFIFRCLHGQCSSLFHSFFTPLHDIRSRQITRGAHFNLLKIPFLPSPAGRSTIMFTGAVLWNELPAHIRSKVNRDSFISSLNS